MLKKILIIGIIVFLLAYYSKAQAAQTEQQQEAEEQQQQQEQKQEAINKLNVQSIVTTFLGHGDYQLQVLPVHAEQWAPLIQISKTDWPYAKEIFTQNGKNFSDMYWKVEKVSSKVCKTGVYKKEFNDIRDALVERANW